MKKRTMALAAALALTGLLAAGCGDSKSSSSSSTTTAASGGGATTTAPAAKTCTEKATADQVKTLDANGDGKLVFGVATPGPRNDGAYYQALVECVDRLAKANGGTSIVVDKIPAADAATQIEGLAKQSVDVMMIGASEIAKPLPDLTAKYPKIFWYCNCGAGTQKNPNYAQSNDDSSEISYSAGYATGLLLKAKNQTKAAFIGNNNLNFEVEAFEAFKLGLAAVDKSYTMTYYATGDFNDVQKATEAYNTAKGQGAAAIYPFLGGAHEPVVKLANKDKLVVMTAGSSKGCSRTDISYDLEVRFDAGDYLDTLIKELFAGTFKEGDIRTFHVGKDPEPGAKICKPTTDQTAAMKTVYTDIAAGKFDNDFFAIKKKAYNF